MGKQIEHVGFQLHSYRDIDVKCMKILDNLPDHETKCSYIRKAIIYYSDHYSEADSFLKDAISNMNTEKEKYGYVYILRSKAIDGIYKIGDTIYVPNRIKGLKNYGKDIFGIDMHWEFVSAFRYSIDLYPQRHIEKKLKDFFSDYMVDSSECYQNIPLDSVYKFFELFKGKMIDRSELC